MKTQGESSPKYQSFKNSLITLGMNKKPKGMKQKTILQHIFKFSNIMESFEKFRLVSKTWQNAVETNRFDQPYAVRAMLGKLQNSTIEQPPQLFSKLLKNTKSLLFHFQNSERFDLLASLILKNTKHLTSIECLGNNIKELSSYQNFSCQLLQNHSDTVQNINYGTIKFTLPADVEFPKLVSLSFTSSNNSAEFLSMLLSKDLPNLKNVEIIGIESDENLQKFIGENYVEHCISCSCWASMLNYIPFKVVCPIYNTNFAELKYTNQIQYLDIYMDSDNFTLCKEWLTDMPNLKGICLCADSCEYITEVTDLTCPAYSPKELNGWNETLKYYKSFGIQILTEEEFQEAKSKLSKKLRWKFTFE